MTANAIWIFGSGGIGTGIRDVFVDAGWGAQTFDRMPEARADHRLDLADRHASERVLAEIDSVPRPSVVAAAFGRVIHGSTGSLSEADTRAIVEDNLIALANLLWLMENGPYLRDLAVLYVIGSNAAFATRPEQAIYAATKAAAVSLVRSAAFEFGRSRTSVVGIAPGTVMVERNAARVRRRFPNAPEVDDRPGGRVLVPRDIGEFMLRTLPTAAHLTGRTVVLDAGSSLRPSEKLGP